VEEFNFQYQDLLIPGIILICLIALAVAIMLFLRNYIKVPPNKAAIISGRKHKLADGSVVGFRIVHGGATFKWPLLEQVDYLSLDILSIPTKTTGVITKEGVPISVMALANTKIDSEEVSLRSAAERFLGRPSDRIREIVADTLETHLRGVCATMTVEEINGDRMAFAQRMLEEAAADLKKMGFTIDTWSIQHIEDDQGYLKSLGMKRTAEVKRDASVGEAEALADAEIKTAEAQREAKVKATTAQREGEVAANKNLEEIAEAERDLAVKKAQLEAQVAVEAAKRDQAGPKATADAEKEVLVARVSAEKAQTEAQIELEETRAQRREKELQATIIKQAEADKQKMEIDAEATRKASVIRAEGEKDSSVIKAEGAKQATVIAAEADKEKRAREGEGEAAKVQALAKADAAKIRAIGEAEAAKVKAIGEAEADAEKAKLLAEAEGILKKAEAMKELDQSAKFMFVLESAPNIIESLGKAGSNVLTPVFQSVSEGLSGIDKVTIIESGDGGGKGLTNFAQAGPTLVFNVLQHIRSLGLDIQPILDKLGVNVIDEIGLEALAEPTKEEKEKAITIDADGEEEG
jgi:flotillin